VSDSIVRCRTTDHAQSAGEFIRERDIKGDHCFKLVHARSGGWILFIRWFSFCNFLGTEFHFHSRVLHVATCLIIIIQKQNQNRIILPCLTRVFSQYDGHIVSVLGLNFKIIINLSLPISQTEWNLVLQQLSSWTCCFYHCRHGVFLWRTEVILVFFNNRNFAKRKQTQRSRNFIVQGHQYGVA